MYIDKNKLSPIVIFAYKRVDLLEKTVLALKNCDLALYSDLIVYSDGPKNQIDIEQVDNVREFISNIKGFKKVTWKFSTKNKGLAKSIISGVTEILSYSDSVIVLEDDLITSPNFLHYMNQALIEYKNVSNVMSISAYTPPIKKNTLSSFDNYFTQRASSWGWATWKNQWENIDWEVSDYKKFNSNIKEKRKFNKMGSDLSLMLKHQMDGKINSWAIRWCYHQFKNNLYSVFPFISKVSNIGFNDSDATHTTSVGNRYNTHIDSSKKNRFNFNLQPKLNKDYIKQFTTPYSIKARIINKVTRIFR
ncbi:glycosyltransferase [uncultured Maribacter sp.]|uniref:glycosyltransferase n=1 Tax=uncultured Maribacter sp. TaxID=431308 RepID=UPI002629F7C8|nr:glycosyltransferase [uncultured Maribacter sp.]